MHPAKGRLQRLGFLPVLGMRQGLLETLLGADPTVNGQFLNGLKGWKDKRSFLLPPVPWTTGYACPAIGATARLRSGGCQSHLSFMLRAKCTWALMNVSCRILPELSEVKPWTPMAGGFGRRGTSVGMGTVTGS